MTDLSPSPRPSNKVLQKALKVLQDPFRTQDGENEEAIASVLENIHFFQKVVEAPIRVDDFIELAKFYFHYEVYSSGTVLVKDKEYANKFFIILKGDVQKICQRSQNEIDQKLELSREKAVKSSSPKKHISLYPAYPSSPKFKKGMTMDLSLKHKHLVPSIGDIDTRTTVSGTTIIGSKNTLATETSSVSPIGRNLMRREDVSSRNLLTTASIKVVKEYGASMQEIDFSRGTIISNESIDVSPPLSRKVHSQVFSKSNKESPERQITKRKMTDTSDIKKSREQKVARTGSLLTLKTIEDDNICLDEENLQFLQLLVSQNPELKEKCFVGDVPKVIISKTYHSGQFFGENFHKQYQPKENGMMAVSSQKVHLLTITRENFKTLIQQLYRTANEKIQLFTELLPSFSEEIINNFTQYFVPRSYKKGEIIYAQNDPVDALYVLQKGGVRLVKEVDASPSWNSQSLSNSVLASSKASRKVELPIANIMKSQFFGEELLLGNTLRQYTAISSSQDTTVYVFDNHGHESIKGKFPNFVKVLRDQAQERFAWREQRATDLYTQQNIMNKPTIALPALNIPKLLISNSNRAQDDLNQVKDTISSSEIEYDTTEPDFFQQIQCMDKVFTQEISMSPRNKNKTSDIYKNKYSRKMKASSPVEIKGGFFPNKREENLGSNHNSPKRTSNTNNILEFNVRKELVTDLKTKKSKLLKLINTNNTKTGVTPEITPKNKSESPKRTLKNVKSFCFVNLVGKGELASKTNTSSDYFSLLTSMKDSSPNGIIGGKRIKKLLRTTFSISGPSAPMEEK